MHPDIVCSLDIGSSSIRALIAKSHGTSSEEILGVASTPTRGFSKGVVSNLSELSDSIEEAIGEAESRAHFRVRRLITNAAGVHIRTFKSHGSIHISDRPTEIRREDVSRCMDSAKFIAMSLDRDPIHLIPEQFFIDDKLKVEEPLGLFGSKLDVDLNIITSLSSILQNITKAVNLAGYEVEDMVASGAGTSLAIFEKKDFEGPAVIIDVGKDITEVALFIGGVLRDCFYFPFGGDDLTYALQDNLRLMFKDAEELRMKYGIVAKEKESLDESEIVLPSNIISKRDISNLLLPKVEEVMQDVYKKITPFLKHKKKALPIYIVGGLSKMDGFIERVEENISVPVQMGRIVNSKDFNDIDFACSLGLARYHAKKYHARKAKYISNTNTFVGKAISKAREIIGEYF